MHPVASHIPQCGAPCKQGSSHLCTPQGTLHHHAYMHTAWPRYAHLTVDICEGEENEVCTRRYHMRGRVYREGGAWSCEWCRLCSVWLNEATTAHPIVCQSVERPRTRTSFQAEAVSKGGPPSPVVEHHAPYWARVTQAGGGRRDAARGPGESLRRGEELHAWRAPDTGRCSTPTPRGPAASCYNASWDAWRRMLRESLKKVKASPLCTTCHGVCDCFSMPKGTYKGAGGGTP